MTNNKSHNVVKETSFHSVSSSTQTSITFKTNEQLIDEKEKTEHELTTKSEELQRVYDEKTKHKNENLRLKRTVENLEDQLGKIRKKSDSQGIQTSSHTTGVVTITQAECETKMTRIQESLAKKTKECTEIHNNNKNLIQQ